MRHSIVFVALAAVSLFATAACTQAPEIEEEPALAVDQPLLNRTHTTRKVCTDCGCTPTELACNCGLSGPSPKEQACIDNGGPVKVLAEPVYAPSAPIGGGGAAVFAP